MRPRRPHRPHQDRTIVLLLALLLALLARSTLVRSRSVRHPRTLPATSAPRSRP